MLALGCTYAGGPGSSLIDPADLQALSEAMMSGDRERSIRQMYLTNVSAGFAATEANYAPFRAMATSVPAPLPVIMLQMQAIGAHDTSARLAELAAPTLVIHGTADRMVPVANAESIAAALPAAQLERLDGVGHLFWWEQPERSAELIAAHALG
jgi:3-oxoadipate enol-lactonase